MCIAWQWPLWAVWTLALPLMIYTGHWLGGSHATAAVLVYLAPTGSWALLAATTASLETKHTYSNKVTPSTFVRRVRRLVPYVVVNTGMLPHQFSAFVEGLFGGMHSEFERTPKAASIGSTSTAVAPGPGAPSHPASPTGTKAGSVRIHWPYVLAEAFYVAYQLAWVVLFAGAGLVLCAVGAAYMALCVLVIALFYGDHDGKVAFVFDRRR